MQRRVLVFDSAESSRELLCEFLSENGYLCVPAWDAQSALQACLRQDFAVALLDVDLRSVPGTEVLRLIKGARPRLPVAVLTACGNARTLLEASRLGARECIHKPIALSDLLEKVQCLARASMAEDGGELLRGYRAG